MEGSPIGTVWTELMVIEAVYDLLGSLLRLLECRLVEEESERLPKENNEGKMYCADSTKGVGERRNLGTQTNTAHLVTRKMNAPLNE